MNAKTLGAALLMCAWLSSAAWGQALSYGRVPPAAVTAAGGDPAAPTQLIAPAGSSRWLCSTPTSCDDPIPGHAIGTELYLHTGVSIPIGSQTLGDASTTGIMVGGGVRTLFYSDDMSAAWVVDAGLSHIENGATNDKGFALKVIDFVGDTPTLVQFGTPLRPALNIRTTHRTYVNLGAGREWFFGEPADSHGSRWRFGIDGGGRYGTLSQEYDRIKHRTDVIGGIYGAVHAEYECPCRWGMFVLGARSEYSYTWSDILQQASDIQEINVLGSIGLRF